MTRTDILRDTIAFLRAYPFKHVQSHIYYSGTGTGCVIGWSAVRNGAVISDGYIDTYPGGARRVKSFALNFLGLDEDDYNQIFSTDATLNSIEAVIDEIEDREATREVLVSPVGKVTVKVDGFEFDVLPADLKGFVDGLRALNPDRRIVKITEEVL